MHLYCAKLEHRQTFIETKPWNSYNSRVLSLNGIKLFSANRIFFFQNQLEEKINNHVIFIENTFHTVTVIIQNMANIQLTYLCKWGDHMTARSHLIPFKWTNQNHTIPTGSKESVYSILHIDCWLKMLYH